ncbi:fungal-specific transcription factor domain-containing protein [Talaromyces proteolyticus]|uniref:Fungal-specific transcription factor domain-containing protein n=1 Tax=Talaromyces proteolyticus TaxID=1131652 RepID=A0AAD4Q2T1_9EURO|nr:fungal-specific transcription factor domain-containing protein [Talaromyces proteolyticus]KAH8700701.1 fungal-specific transcription factor domain-containing protein [Talaromyces proteolyticus]
MSIAQASREPQPLQPPQPFQCLVCQSRFTRHENLKRHAALHSRPQDRTALYCQFCPAKFSRPDLRCRHMKRKHPEHEQTHTTKRSRQERPSFGHASDDVRSPHVERASPGSQDGSSPSYPGEDSELSSTAWSTALQYTQRHRRTGDSAPTSNIDNAQLIADSLTPHLSLAETNRLDQTIQDATDLEQSLLLETSFLKRANGLHTQSDPILTLQSRSFDSGLAGFNFNLLSNNLSQIQEDWSPSTFQITQGCDLFFSHVSHFIPFLHQPTFDTTQTTPYLTLSILSLAYQYGEDPDCADQSGSGVSLSRRCFYQARALIAAEEGSLDCSASYLPMVQSYLLLQICAMMYLCSDDSAHGLKMHSDMISLARAGGLTQPLPVESAMAEDLDSLWRQFTKTESHKRTLFAVHQIDALWYQLFSIPRQISHLEIKHELPCSEDHWTASSSAEWAHRQLVAKNPGPLLQYVDAVRHFLSSDADLSAIPAFDPYGAINIAQFLISSAREISGWSTMTGLLSIDRFAALRSSLIALNPYIHPETETAMTTHGAICAATWQTAMIELQMWSPLHTDGVVGASVDALLKQLTSLAPSSEFICEANTIKAIQTHIDWFLRYLDTTLVPDREAPWVTLYAYKAFLIAWQLVREWVSDSMRVVGIQDGDIEGALTWARRVFGRRQKWQLGKLIISCLDELGQ